MAAYLLLSIEHSQPPNQFYILRSYFQDDNRPKLQEKGTHTKFNFQFSVNTLVGAATISYEKHFLPCC